MSESSSFQVKAEWYWSKDRAEREWTHLWTKMWHLGPRAEELAESGDVMVHTLGHESLLFVRDGERIRGYYNVCRHRGNRLLLGDDGPSYATEFACAFHGWRYGRRKRTPTRACENTPSSERCAPSPARYARGVGGLCDTQYGRHEGRTLPKLGVGGMPRGS